MEKQENNDHHVTPDEPNGQSCNVGGCGPTLGGIPLIQLILVLFFVLMAFAAARGQVLQEKPAFQEKIDVVEHLGDTIDLTLPVVNSDGDTVTLGSEFEGDLPIVLVFHYSDCPMLCSLVLNGVSSITRASDLVPGEDYRILTVSVDPHELPQRSRASEERFNGELPDTKVGQPWTFYTAEQATLDSLTSQVGFKYYYDSKRKEFMHPAVVQILSPEGKIARYLYGIEYKKRDFRLGIVEASNGEIGTTIDRVLLYCMHYDPDAEGYVVVAGQVMKLGGAVTLVIFGFALSMLWLKDKGRRKNVSA
ncbi:SCO family protein [bacterium]|nr:SCO family protein [bacterium]